MLKIVLHARSGGNIEIMGLLQGKIRGDAFLLTDSFRLPVEGTETRVNAGESANEYMVEFTELNEQTHASNEAVCGWYHSHPGYGCWLSGIDVATQALYQSHQDPFVAIVVDPHRSAAAGRVDIGAFRAYPPGYTPPASQSSALAGVPREKIEDFGAHFDRYYPLEVEYYRSPGDEAVLETIWQEVWTKILADFIFREERRRFAQDLALATSRCKAEQGSEFTTFAGRVKRCSCDFLNQALRAQLHDSIFRPVKEQMDTD